MANFFAALFLPVLAYLIGSIPSGLIVGRFGGVGDIRQIGSGNIGATNMLRTGKKSLALATLLLDAAKGFLAVQICRHLDAHISGNFAVIGYWYGLCAVMGHVWPIWLNFKGGKGVATTLGVYFTVLPWMGVVTVALWLLTFYRTRYSSLSALISIGISPIVGFFLGGASPAIMALILASIVIFKHKDNVRRLMAGTETKWSNKA